MKFPARGGNVALVFPPVAMEGRYYRIARWVTVPPQGLAFVGAVLERAGHAVTIIDSAAMKYSADEAAREVVRARPSILGLTGTTMSVRSAAELAAAVKRELPDVVVVMGGPHFSAEPEETMRRFPCFDVGVVGEGEETAVELFGALRDGLPIDNIRGILYREDGKLVRTGARPLIEDLDALPFPAYHLLPELTKFYQHVVVRVDRMPSASLLISRGCAKGKCTFCSRNVYGGRARIHSAEYAISLFEHLANKYGVRSLNFEDEDLLAFPKVMRLVCEEMISRRMDLTWAVSGRADLADEELLKLMRRAGCWNISFGIESGCQEILDRIKKRETLEKIREAVGMSKRAGMTVKGFFMIGHPGETLETIQRTIDFSKSIGLDYFQMSFVAPLPGTELYDTAHEWGEFNSDWDELNIWNPVFIPRGLSREILERESLRAFREFYFRPGIIFSVLKRTFTTRHIFAYLRDGARFLGFLRRG